MDRLYLSLKEGPNSPETIPSPVTSLAYDLCSLSTKSSCVTPKRQILQSSGLSCNVSHSDQTHIKGQVDSPVSYDSPMFDEGVLKDTRSSLISKRSKISWLRHSQFSRTLDGKENIPSSNTQCSVAGPLQGQDTKTDSFNDCQDSGYTSGQSEKEDGLKSFAAPRGVPPRRLKTHSSESLFSDHLSTSSGYASPESFTRTSRSSSVVSTLDFGMLHEESDDDFMNSFTSMGEDEDETEIPVNTFADLIRAPLSVVQPDSKNNCVIAKAGPSRGRTQSSTRRCLSMLTEDEASTTLDSTSVTESLSTYHGRLPFTSSQPLDTCKKAAVTSQIGAFGPCQSPFYSITDRNNNSDTHNPDLSWILREKRAKSNFKRPEPPLDLGGEFQIKRAKSVSFCGQAVSKNEVSIEQHALPRCYSESHHKIMMAVQKSDQNPNLVGDFSRTYTLPLVKGKHQDLKAISPDTLQRILKGEFKNVVSTYTIVDCRYPYEYEGGHIKGAKNVYTQEGIMNEFFHSRASSPAQTSNDASHIVIFHCEFSSERGPKMCRFLRNKDREENKDHYPHLLYPEIYLLHGGYKAFFEEYKELCEPRKYTPMNHKDHGEDLRIFRAKSKSWGADSKGRVAVRPGLKF